MKTKIKMGCHHLMDILRSYKSSYVALLVLIVGFIIWEGLIDIFDYLMVFLLFLSVDFYIDRIGTRTPWKLRFLGAMIAESAFLLVNLSIVLADENIIMQVVSFTIVFAFLIGSLKYLPDKIDWSGNSKIAQSYNKQIQSAVQIDAEILSKYNVIPFIGTVSAGMSSKLGNIVNLSFIGSSLYFSLGLLIGLLIFMNNLFFTGLIESSIVRFSIIFLIVLFEIWNSHKELKNKISDNFVPSSEDIHFNFTVNIFRAKFPFVYFTLTVFNFSFSFAFIFVFIRLIYELAYMIGVIGITNDITTNLNAEFPDVNSLFLNIYIIFWVISGFVIVYMYLSAHRRILHNFSLRQNNQQLIKYSKNQEIWLFMSLNYLIIIYYLTVYSHLRDISFSLTHFFISLPAIIFSLILIFNHKFGKKTQLSSNREHVIWTSMLLLYIIEIKTLGAVILSFLLLMAILTYAYNAFTADDENEQSSQFKRMILSVTALELVMILMGASITEIVIMLIPLISLIFFSNLLIKIRSSKVKQKNTWLTRGPHTIEELIEHGHALPSDDQSLKSWMRTYFFRHNSIIISCISNWTIPFILIYSLGLS